MKKSIKCLIDVLNLLFFFEIEKIKKYLKTIDDIEKLEGDLFVLSKTFFKFFLEKKNKKNASKRPTA